MSAYVVSTDTIDLIITAAQRFARRYAASFYPSKEARDLVVLDGVIALGGQVNPQGYPNELGDLLLRENEHSVSVLYNEPADPHAPYQFRPVDLDAATAGACDVAVLVLKSIGCLRYQSCEDEDYATTNAAKLLDWIEGLAIHALTGYGDAPWGWTKDWAQKTLAEKREAHNRKMGLVDAS